MILYMICVNNKKYFEYFDDFVDELIQIAEADELPTIKVIGKYHEIQNLIMLLVQCDVIIDTIDLRDEHSYTNEYTLTIYGDTEVIALNCKLAKRDSEYIYEDADVMYIFDNACIKIMPYCESDSICTIAIGEIDEDYIDEEIESPDSKDKKDGYSIKIKCNLDADEAMAIIDKMENRLLEVNKIFNEMNNMKNLLGF
jgi:hypothetical protein